jgi:CRISPR-associated protein Cas2
MGETRFPLSEYKGMWLMVLFDLPVVSKEEKKNYVRFRNALIQDGFTMLQYSVYTDLGAKSIRTIWLDV